MRTTFQVLPMGRLHVCAAGKSKEQLGCIAEMIYPCRLLIVLHNTYLQVECSAEIVATLLPIQMQN